MEDLKRMHGTRLQNKTILEWDDRTEGVLARRRTMLDSLILEDTPLCSEEYSQEDNSRAVLSGIARLGLNCLPWTEELRQWQARVLLMRQMDKDDPFRKNLWPDVSDTALMNDIQKHPDECWLNLWLSGISSRSQFSGISLDKALHALLTYPLSQRLEQEAPSHIKVPSGSQIRIDYTPASGPVLAVKLQEMFGQLDTPSVCSGRCPLILHLLSPAGRPLQVTQDLPSFWKSGYSAVRAEMRGRYPKHPWPEDPLSALPTRKTSKALAKKS
jgi:ATP-dependent helicase HrpB